MIQVFGVASGPRPPGYETVQEGGSEVVAVCRRLPAGPPSVSVEAAEAYVGSIMELMRDRALVPARFPTVVGARRDLETWIRDRREALEAELRFLKGKVELGLRALPAPCDQGAGPEDSGTAFMTGRLHRYRRRQASAASLGAVVDRWHPLLGARAVAGRHEPEAATASYLVPAAEAGSFRHLTAELPASDGIRLFCTGPWPPFSFVETAFPAAA